MTKRVPRLSGTVQRVVHPGIAYRYWSEKYQKFVWASWPTKKAKRSEKSEAASAEFKQVTQIIKYVDGQDVAIAYAMSRGTALLPRDILAKNAYGTQMMANGADGAQYRSLRMASQELQTLLNSITNQPGAIIVRLADQWGALQPGDAGQVLAMDAMTGLPEWIDGNDPAQALLLARRAAISLLHT